MSKLWYLLPVVLFVSIMLAVVYVEYDNTIHHRGEINMPCLPDGMCKGKMVCTKFGFTYQCKP